MAARGPRRPRRGLPRGRRLLLLCLPLALCVGVGRHALGTVPAAGYTRGRVDVRLAMLLVQSTDAYAYSMRNPLALPLLAHSPMRPPEYHFFNPLAPLTAADTAFTGQPWYPASGTALTENMPAYWVIRDDATLPPPDLSLFDILILDEGRPIDFATLGALRPRLEAFVRNGGTLWINNWGESTFTNGGRNLTLSIRHQTSTTAGVPATAQPKRPVEPRHPLLWGESLLGGDELDAVGEGVAEAAWTGIEPDGFVSDRLPLAQWRPVVVTDSYDQTAGAWKQVEVVSAARIGNGTIVVSAGNTLGRLQDWFVPFAGNFADPTGSYQQLPPYEAAGALKLAYNLVHWTLEWRDQGGGLTRSQMQNGYLPAALGVEWVYPSEKGEASPSTFIPQPVGADGMVFTGDQAGNVYAFQSPPSESLPPGPTASGRIRPSDGLPGGLGVDTGYPYDLVWTLGGGGEIRGLSLARLEGQLLLYVVRAFPEGFGSVACHNAVNGTTIWQFPFSGEAVDRRTSGTPRGAPTVVDNMLIFATYQPPPQAGGAAAGQSYLFFLDAQTGRMNAVYPLGGRGMISSSSPPAITWRVHLDQRGARAVVPYFSYTANSPSTMIGNAGRLWSHPLTLTSQLPDWNGDLNALRLRVAADAYTVEVSPIDPVTGLGRVANLDSGGGTISEVFTETFLTERVSGNGVRLTVADLELLRLAPYPVPPPQGTGTGYTIRYTDTTATPRDQANVVFDIPPTPLSIGSRVDPDAFGAASPATDGEVLVAPTDVNLPDLTQAQRRAEPGAITAARMLTNNTPALLWQFAGMLRPPEAGGTPATEEWYSAFPFTPALARDAIFAAANYQAVWDVTRNRPGVTDLTRRGTVYAIRRVPDRCVFLPGGIRPGTAVDITVDGRRVNGPLQPNPDYSVLYQNGAVCLTPSGMAEWQGRTAEVSYTRDDNGAPSLSVVTFPSCILWRWTDAQVEVVTPPVLTATVLYVGAWDSESGETWLVGIDRTTGAEVQRYRLGVAGTQQAGYSPLSPIGIVDGRLVIGTGLATTSGSNALFAFSETPTWVADGARLFCAAGQGFGIQTGGFTPVDTIAPRRVIDATAEPHASLRYTAFGGRPLQTPNQFQPIERPTRVRLLDRDQLLVVDTGTNRVLDLDEHGRVRWQYPHPDGALTPEFLTLNAPSDAVRFRRAVTLSDGVVTGRGSDTVSVFLQVSNPTQFTSGMPAWAFTAANQSLAPLGTLWRLVDDPADVWRVTAPVPAWVQSGSGVHLFVPGVNESTLIADSGNSRVLLVDRPTIQGRLRREWARDPGGTTVVRPQYLDSVNVIADHTTRIVSTHPQLRDAPIGSVTGRPMYAALTPLVFNTDGTLETFAVGIANHPSDPTGRDPYLSVLEITKVGPAETPWRINATDTDGRLNLWPRRQANSVPVPVQLLRQLSYVPFRGTNYLLYVDRNGLKLMNTGNGLIDFEYTQDHVGFPQPNDYLADLSGLPPLPTETLAYQALAEFHPLAAQLTLTGSLLLANGTPTPIAAGELTDIGAPRKNEIIEVFFGQARTTRLRRLDQDSTATRTWFHWFLLPNPYDPSYPGIGTGTTGLTQPLWVERR